MPGRRGADAVRLEAAHRAERAAPSEALPVSMAGGGVSRAVLIGGALALLGYGLHEVVSGVSDLPSVGPVIAGVVLACLAIGVMLPRRVALYLGRRWRGQLPASGEPMTEAGLLWTVLAMATLISGLGLALAAPLSVAAANWHEWLEHRFLWPVWGRPALAVLTIFPVAAPGLVPLGLGLNCLCRLSGRQAAWSVGTLGWILIGTGGGAAVIRALWQTEITGAVLLASAAVPVLLVAIGSARRMQSGQDGEAEDESTAFAGPVEATNRWRLFSRVWIGWVAGSAAALVVVWTRILGVWWPVAAGLEVAPLCLAAAIGVGLILGDRAIPNGVRRFGDFGELCALSGLGMAGLTSLPAVWLGRASGGRMSVAVMIVLGTVLGLVLGHLLAYGHRTVLQRVGARARHGETLLSVSLGAAAIVVWVLASAGPGVGSAFAILAAIALSLVAWGGSAVIHEPAYGPGARRRRLAVVFASIAIMMYVLPLAGRRWSAALHTSGATAIDQGELPDSRALTLLRD